MATVKLTTEEFKNKVFDYTQHTEWKYAGDTPALIDFYADWCGPCKMVAPVLEELSEEYGDKVHIYKVDTEAEQELAAVFGIRSIPSIRVLRDPTRGGVATTLNEIAQQSKVGIRLQEDRLPIDAGVRASCELLGLDPLYIANEGKFIAIVPGSLAQDCLALFEKLATSEKPAIIGDVIAENQSFVELETAFGSKRLLDMLSGEILPRIC